MMMRNAEIAASLRSEVYGIRGTIGHNDTFSVNALLRGNLRLKCQCLRLRVISYLPHLTSQVFHKWCDVSMGIYVRTTIYPNTLVSVYVVSVTGNHLI